MPNPLVCVIVSWMWLAILTVFLRVSPATVHRFLLQPYYSSYLEIVFVGLIPVLFTIFGREKWSQYGLTVQGLAKSIFWSVIFVAVVGTLSRLSTGHWIGFGTLVSSLGFPAKVYYALLGIIAYGPLEMFFFVWLVSNTEEIFESKSWSFLLSLAITAFLYGLLHYIFQGLIVGFLAGFIFFVLGCRGASKAGQVA